jgi:FHS family glucose/mannose:H+ symporter-like MFS transporter
MIQNPPRTILVSLTIVCFLAFFIFGFTDNLKGPTLPAMLDDLHFNIGVGGNILFAEYMGFLCATLLTGVLADRFGLKVVILLAGVCLAFGVSGYSTFHTASMLGISLFVVGLGLGAFELGPNAIIISLYKEQKGLYLNLMSVLHGLGSLIAPLFAGWLFSLNGSWRLIYRWDLPLIVLFVLCAIPLQFPKEGAISRLDFKNIPSIAFKDNLRWYYLAIALYVSAEIGMASWLVAYFQQARGLTITVSNYSLSLFFAMLMAGRLVGGFFVHRVGYLKSILFASIGASVCILLGLFGPINLSIIFLPLTGGFFSIIFPTITAAVTESQTENVNTILGVLFTFAGLGGVMGPWAVAWMSDFFDLQTGFAVNLVLSLLMVPTILVLIKGESYGKKT